MRLNLTSKRFKKTQRILFAWDEMPDKIFKNMMERIKSLGYKSIREYIRYLINEDLKKTKRDNYGRTHN